MPAAKFLLVLITAFLLVPNAARASTVAAAEDLDLESPAVIQEAKERIAREFAGSEVQPMDESTLNQILKSYAHLDPKHYIDTAILKKTVLYYDKNKSSFPNPDFVTIVDFTPRSDKYRLFVIDMKSGLVERFHTSHGVGSDKNADGFAERFSNVPNSGASSLGFARTTDTFVGHYGRAVRMDGLSSTNSNIRERAVIYHGWDQVHEKNVIQGMSHGCITLDYAVKDGVLDKVKGGSLVNMAFTSRK